MLRIDVTSLDPGVHHVEREPEAEEVDLDPDQFSALHVLARLDYQEDRILVALDVAAVATLECDRTLALFDQPLEGTYRVLFAPPSFSDKADTEAYDEVRELRPADREIDITNEVRDTLLLAIPQRKVAPGAEEEELPTAFGAPEDEEDAIDPRWDALRKLKMQDDES